MFRVLFVITLLAMLKAVAIAPPGYATESLACADMRITVEATFPEDAARTCRAAEVALAEMAQCNMPLERSVTITLRDTLPANCLGLYHCGEDRIDLLSPQALDVNRSKTSAFAHLPTPRFFDSLVAHELAHAAFDAQLCPLESCITAAEYLAYTTQIRVLSDEERAPITAMMEDKIISRDEINVMLLFMAPQTFAQKAWGHLNQRPDPCTFVGQIMSGHVLMDRAHP